MLRLKPIRKAQRRGPSDRVLRIADGAFWAMLVFAAAFGGATLTDGFPKLVQMFIAPGAIAARADVAARGPVVRMDLAPQNIPEIRTTIATEDYAPALMIGKPAIAIVIDDLGADAVHTRRASTLPRAVALSFLPYPEDTPRLAREAAHAGHEILVHVPMEAVGSQNPGPMTLKTGLPADEIVRRFDWALSRVPGFSGVNNHEGSRFTADGAALAPVMARLAERHVFFFDSRTTPDSQVVAVARAYGVTTASRDVFLDDEENIDAVDAQLRALEMRARENGVAIAIGHPHEITLDAISYWAAHQQGFALVSLKDAIRLKTERTLQKSLTLADR